MEEIKQLLEEMKEVRKKQTDFLSRSDSTDVTVKAAVKKLDDRLDSITEQAKAIEDQKGRLDQIETKLNRPDLKWPETKKDPSQVEFFDYMRKGAVGPTLEKALSTQSDPSGGYPVPMNMSGRFLDTLVEISEIRSIVTVETISEGNTLQVDGEDSTQWGVGMTSESATKPETGTGKLRVEEIPTHEQYARPKMTTQALKDPRRNLEEWLNRKGIQRMAQHEGQILLTGTGVGQAEGLMTATGITEVNSGDASLVKADTIIDLAYSLPAFYARNARWLMKRTTVRDIRKLKDGNGNYLWQPGLSGTVPATIEGSPFTVAEDMPAVASGTFPILFGDFKAAYTLVDREGLNVLRNPFKEDGWVFFYMTRRFGGQVVLSEALRKYKIAV